MKTFTRDKNDPCGPLVGFVAETPEEKEMLVEFHHRALRGEVFVNGCSDPEGGNAVALTIQIKK